MKMTLTTNQKKDIIEYWLIYQYLKVEDHPNAYKKIYQNIQNMRKRVKAHTKKKVLKHFDFVYNFLFLSNWTHIPYKDVIEELGYS